MPPKKPSTNRKSEKSKALRLRCTVRVDPGRMTLGGIASSMLDNIMGDRERYTCEILLMQDKQRVTYSAGTDKEFTVVFGGRAGLVIWDQATRRSANIPADNIPRTKVLRADALEVSTREDRERITVVMSAEESGLGKVRHELTISRNQEWAKFGPALMRVLHCGPSCHATSGLDWQKIAEYGLITAEKTLTADGEVISEMEFESPEFVDVDAREFAPPPGFRSLAEQLKETGEQRPVYPPTEDDPTPQEIQTAVIKQALEGGTGVSRSALRISESLTPDCLGSTRFGAMTASLHQDALTVASNAVNLVAPLLGSTTIAGGIWTVPWLGNLAGLGATAPGSGLFCMLREPRNPALPPGAGGGGGRGLLDRLAFRSLYERDAAGLLRTQREFAAMTLAATLATWGVGAPTDANLLAASGDLTMLSASDQRVITEGYETAELGVFRITGLPFTMTPFSFGSMTLGPITTPPLFTIGVAGIGGTVNFSSLAGTGLINTATIGSSGNIVLGFSLPAITLTGTITRSPTAFGWAVLTVGTIGFCFAFPLLCPLAIVVVTLAGFILTNVTVVTATLTAVTWTFDVSFGFDPNTERVEPFVNLLGRTGTVAVSTFGPTPNIIANAVDSLIAAFGNFFDAWGALIAGEATKAIQQTLRDQGLQLPVAGRQNELRAIDGDAQSSAGSVLQLTADVRPIGNIASEPFTTQVLPRELMRQQLLLAHLNIRRDLNPQPVPPPPGPGPAIAVGTFAGLGLSQNALNYYIFHQWLQRRFEVTITDPAIINKMVSIAPKLFARLPVNVHIWPATAPRIEIAPREIANGTRPLIAYFDDVRACFEVPNAQGKDGLTPFVGLWELSCNFKTPATIEVAWPWVFGLRVDPLRTSGGDYEPRTWEFVDPNVPAIMGTVGPQDLAKLVDIIADMIIAPITAIGVRAPASVRPWTRPLPAMQQEIFPAIQPGPPLRPQQAYLEFLARRKAVYALPVIDTALLELFDGSGAPALNLLLGIAGAPPPLPTTPGTMRCAQGAALRNFVFPLIGLTAGP